MTITGTVSVIDDEQAALETYQRDHHIVDVVAGLGHAALLSDDGGRWGLAIASSGLWYEVTGLRDRDLAIRAGTEMLERDGN